MIKKNVILLLTNPCLIDPRVELEASILADSGYKTQIIAWDRICSSKDIEIRNGYKIVRIKIKSAYSKGLSQIFKLIKFYFAAYKYIKNEKNISIVHCNDLDTLPLGFILKLLLKVRLVYDAHEIYSEMAFNNRLLQNLCVFIEKQLLKKVDLFFTVGMTRYDWYKTNGYPIMPVILGNYKEKIKLKINIKREKKKLGIDDKIVILYIGVLNKERMIVELINAVKNNNRFFLFIAGEGTELEKITGVSYGADNIKYLGYIDDPEILNFYNYICDVIYYGLHDKYNVSKTAVPNKMYEAIAYDKIFLTSRTGEMMVLDKDGGLFVYIDELKNDLERICKIIKNKKRRLSITAGNNKLYKIYNQVQFKKILLENYSLL
jgi:glycosyltransferase involved in cell wall biosynthesis